MKIIFMGTPEFAVPTLKALLSSRHQVVAVYTQKPKAAGRGMDFRKSKIHELAETYRIDVFTPDSLKSDEEKENFKKIKADIAVVAAYGMLLPKEILEGAHYGCINIHPSLLPRWRGAAPLQRTIMEGDKRSAVCIMKMDEGLDTGDIILKEEFDIPERANTGWLHDKCADLGATLTLKALDLINEGKAEYKKQSEDGIVYAKKLTKADEVIDFNDTGKEILSKIMGLAPYPGAYFVLNNVKYKVHEADFAPSSGSVVGIVLNNQFHIGCADGVIIPKIIQKEGKKMMFIAEFLKGNKIEVGKHINAVQ